MPHQCSSLMSFARDSSFRKLFDLLDHSKPGFIHVDHHFTTINPERLLPQIPPFRLISRWNTGQTSGSYLVGQGQDLLFLNKYAKLACFRCPNIIAGVA